MIKGLVAKASVRIKASNDKVWDALVNPEMIRQYMFGTEVVSDWKEGNPIIWKGIWNGKSYEDKGIILKYEKKKELEFSHFSPLTGIPDIPENYHTVTYRLTYEGDYMLVALSQDNNATETDREHSQKNWEMVLDGLKKVLEK
jgi:uncharacterized protein YndB with AHSA1/START domain